MRTIRANARHASLLLLAVIGSIQPAAGQYQDTSGDAARGFSNNRVQANISDQGSGYGPSGPYGPYYSRRNNSNQNRPPAAQQQTDGRPNLGLPSDPYLQRWYWRHLTQPGRTDPGVAWSENDGRLVAREVAPGSDLARAGLQPGDELVSIDAQAVHSQAQWQQAIDALPAGREVTMVVQRGGNAVTLRWTPSAQPAEELPSGALAQRPDGEEPRPFNFITAGRMRRGPQGRTWFGVRLDARYPDRAVVQSVDPGSSADEAGLHAGDVILSLSGQDVASPGDLIRMLSQIKPDSSFQLYVGRWPAIPAKAPQGAAEARPEPVPNPPAGK